MKKIAFILFIAIQSFTVYAQQTIDFEIAFQPNTVYEQTSLQSIKSITSYGEGMEPMEQESTSNTTSVTTTGKLSDGIMPVTIKILPEKDTDVAVLMPSGATITGVVQKDGKLSLDSINAPGMQEQMKVVFMKMTGALASQNLISLRKVKVGESFTVETPTEVPMGPITMVINNKSTYTLKKVEAGKAYFDISIVVDITSKDKSQNLKGSGTGKGSMVYDIKNKFFSELDVTSKSSTAIEMQGVNISAEEERDIKTSVKISPAK